MRPPVETASLFAPVIPSKQPSVSPPLASNFQINTNLPPPSAVPPPLSKPIPSSSSSTTSNPYAAKGALNKKVFYDNIIPVAPSTAPGLFLNSATNEQQLPSLAPLQPILNDVFTPLPKSASNVSLNSSLINQQQQQQQVYNIHHSNTTPSLLNMNNNDLINQSAISYDSNTATTTYQNEQSNINNNKPNNNTSNNNTGTMWNWFTQNKLVNTFVEKAKVDIFVIILKS